MKTGVIVRAVLVIGVLTLGGSYAFNWIATQDLRVALAYSCGYSVAQLDATRMDRAEAVRRAYPSVEIERLCEDHQARAAAWGFDPKR